MDVRSQGGSIRLTVSEEMKCMMRAAAQAEVDVEPGP